MAKAQLTDGEHTLTEGPLPLENALRAFYEGVSWSVLRRAIDSGKVRVDDQVVRLQRKQIEPGSRITVRMATPKSKAATQVRLAKNAIVYLDQHLVVVDKPAGVASVPDAQRKDGTLVQLVAARLRKGQEQSGGGRDGVLGVVQRLDMETSGLLVFARTKEAREGLKEQFKSRSLSREYLALVAGHAKDITIQSYLVERVDGKRGSTKNKGEGKFACTHVELVERLQGASLVRCRLETGRTHQIRIHLSEAGHPLLGDKRYARWKIETPPAPRLMLHAATLGFEHPIEGAPLAFEVPLPSDLYAVLNRLRFS